eukprot:TRINITY_DN74773_c0_g1_i1.p1 TRINITY_DN74773_c0_g1~~TRINITY_DN74773_c0_g1_i1.p1  ORF type:complete len:977 (-),score=184.16 TRINITY_DN74773_c0_g1_i1:39-2969(-)
MIGTRSAIALVVLGCGLAVLVGLSQVHQDLVVRHADDDSLEIPAESSAKQEVIRRLNQFPKTIADVESQLLTLEEAISKLAVDVQKPVDAAFFEDKTTPERQWAEPDPAPTDPPVIQHLRPTPKPPVQEAAASEPEADAAEDDEEESAAASSDGEKVEGGMWNGHPWRSDLRCGKLDEGFVVCNPEGSYPCCSNLFWCGATAQHCKCNGCVDYRRMQQRGGSLQGPGEESASAGGGKTVVVVIPFRDRESHLVKFKEYWRWFASKGAPRNPKVSRWEVYVIEQFDAKTFNRGWTFNVGVAVASSQASASPDIGGGDDAVSFDCAVIQDIDYLPEKGVDYTQCDLPTQYSAEIDRFDGKTPYPENCGGIVAMSLGHWRQINGFSNEYYGWGGEDDELYHRLRLNKLLHGDCWPYCKAHERASSRKGKTIRRPAAGAGKFSGQFMHSMNHTKRITDSKAYDKNLKLLREIQAGSNRWRTDGLNNLAFRVVSRSLDESDAKDFGITYHHLKVHRGKEHYAVKDMQIVVPSFADLCSAQDTEAAREGWKVTTLGTRIPWDFDQVLRKAIEAAAGVQQGDAAPSCPGAKQTTVILIDRRRHLAKLLKPQDKDLLKVFFRSMHDPAQDGLIVVDPRRMAAVQSAMDAVDSFAVPPVDFSVCQAAFGSQGMKFSVHHGDACGGGGWTAVPGTAIKGYASEKPGLIPISWCDNSQYWTQRVVKDRDCPQKWANLPWEYGGTMWVAPGNTLCVGSRQGKQNAASYSRILRKPDCGGEGYKHDVGFKSIDQDKPLPGHKAQPQAPLSLCVARKGKDTRIFRESDDCNSNGYETLVSFPALRIDGLSPEEYRFFCIVQKPSTHGKADGLLSTGNRDSLASLCQNKAGTTFALPKDVAAPQALNADQRSRLVCAGQEVGSIQITALGVGEMECEGVAGSSRVHLVAPSVIDLAASTPGVGSARKPLYVLVEEERPCSGFICPGTLRRA